SVTRKALLIVQPTLSVVLVAGATMLARSLANLEHQNFGFQTADRVLVEMNPPAAGYTPQRLNALYREMEDRLKRMPGIEQVGLALYNPMTDNWGEAIAIQGHPGTLGENSGASWDRVSAGYLQALGLPLARGRGFTEA